MKADLKRLGASGAFLYLGAAEAAFTIALCDGATTAIPAPLRAMTSGLIPLSKAKTIRKWNFSEVKHTYAPTAFGNIVHSTKPVCCTLHLNMRILLKELIHKRIESFISNLHFKTNQPKMSEGESLDKVLLTISLI